MIGTGNAFSPGSGQGHSRGRWPVLFMYNLSIITTQTSPMHPILPVGIQSLLPHISLQLGTTSDDPDTPMIWCMADTGAALNTGNYSFYTAIAKRYPHCIAKVFLPKDYYQSFFWVWSMMMCRLSQLICLLAFNFIYPTLLVIETWPPLSLQPFLKSVWMQ